MGLSTIELVGLLGAHLNTDAGVVAHVGEGGCFHAKADADQPCPFLLFAVPRTNLRDSQGLGVAQASGQVAEATIMLSVITQADDPLGLGVMANAADAALRSWTPSGWGDSQHRGRRRADSEPRRRGTDPAKLLAAVRRHLGASVSMLGTPTEPSSTALTGAWVSCAPHKREEFKFLTLPNPVSGTEFGAECRNFGTDDLTCRRQESPG